MRRVVLFCLLLLFSRFALAQSPPAYSLRQYLNIRGAGSPTLSPDGAQVAFLAGTTGTAQVWKVASGSGWPEQLTFFSSGVSALAWSPARSELLAVTDNNGDEQYQFYLVRADGTGVTPLTADPKVRHEFGGWSSDGKNLYYASNARDPRYTDCYLMDAATGKERLVFQKDASMTAEALSSDNRFLAASVSTSNVNNDLYIVDVATGQGRRVTPHTGDARYGVIGFSSDAKSLYLTTDQGRETNNLAEMNVATGAITFLQDEKFDVESAQLSPDGRLLAYSANRDGYEELTVWDTRTRKPVRLPDLPKGIVTPRNFSANGRRLAIGLNTPARPGDVFVLDLAERRARQATFSNKAGIDPATFVEPTLVRYKSFDGLEIPAFLYLPKNAPQDKSLPVILSVHGGPESQERPGFASLYQYFVSRGYAVLAPNIRGSNGYGKSYLALDNGPKRWDALKDLNAAIDFLGTQPALNAGKVAVYGGSYGGFAVLAMLTHYPTRFAAGVDVVGISDFKTFLANTAPYRRANRAAEYGDPEKDSDFLDAISPARHVENIVAPLMVIAGANDPRVPKSEADQIVAKIKARNGVVEYLAFPDEGHGVAKLPNRIRAYEAIVAFLDTYLREKQTSVK